MLGSGAVASANLVIATDITIDGSLAPPHGQLVINPPAGLFVTHDVNDPLLELTHGATTQGVECLVIGSLTGESGRLLIEGGSTLTNSGNWGSLGTFGSASVQRGHAYLGLNAAATGTATITGTGSTWTNSAPLYIGVSGTGEMTIADAGSVSSWWGYIGDNSGSHGTVTVTGTESTWTNSGWLHIGRSGKGEMTVDDGGSVSNGVGYIGENSGSQGTVIVTGTESTWTNSLSLYIGHAGTGQMTIADGGSVSNTLGHIGYSNGSQGTVTVTGIGSTWTNSSTLNVGRFGTGELRIENGGTLSNASSTHIGTFSGSTGAVTITGASSTWTNSSSLNVGAEGTGELTITDGGSVVNSSGSIGTNSGAHGTVTVTGTSSTWTNSSLLYVGQRGTGELTIADGGSVFNRSSRIGQYDGSQGAVTVTGAGSTWTNSLWLQVGQRGTGGLTISDGGSVFNSLSHIGQYDGSQGTVTVTGAGSTWTHTDSLILGGSSLPIETTGEGMLTISDGGTVSVAGTTRIHGGGTVHLEAGGTIRTHHLDPTNGTFHFTGGTLALTGTFTGDLHVPDAGTLTGTGTVGGRVTSAGLVAPGSSPGTLTIDGDYTQLATGSLAIQITGLTPGSEYDRLAVTGDAALAGSLAIILDGFSPSLGDSFAIMSIGGSLIDAGYVLDFSQAPLDGGLSWDDSGFAHNGTINIIPEPGTLTLLALGGLVLMRRRHRPVAPAITAECQWRIVHQCRPFESACSVG